MSLGYGQSMRARIEQEEMKKLKYDERNKGFAG